MMVTILNMQAVKQMLLCTILSLYYVGLYLAKCEYVQLTKPFAINEKLDNEVNSTDHFIWTRFLHLIKGVSSAHIRFPGILTGTQIAC